MAVRVAIIVGNDGERQQTVFQECLDRRIRIGFVGDDGQDAGMALEAQVKAIAQATE